MCDVVLCKGRRDDDKYLEVTVWRLLAWPLQRRRSLSHTQRTPDNLSTEGRNDCLGRELSINVLHVWRLVLLARVPLPTLIFPRRASCAMIGTGEQRMLNGERLAAPLSSQIP
jgi:hypothetical protein